MSWPDTPRGRPAPVAAMSKADTAPEAHKVIAFLFVLVAAAAVCGSTALLIWMGGVETVVAASGGESYSFVPEQPWQDNMQAARQRLEPLLATDDGSAAIADEAWFHFILMVDRGPSETVRFRVLDDRSAALRPGVKLEGSGKSGFYVGERLWQRYPILHAPHGYRLGTRVAPLVGKIVAPGTVYESEVWVDRAYFDADTFGPAAPPQLLFRLAPGIGLEDARRAAQDLGEVRSNKDFVRDSFPKLEHVHERLSRKVLLALAVAFILALFMLERDRIETPGHHRFLGWGAILSPVAAVLGTSAALAFLGDEVSLHQISGGIVYFAPNLEPLHLFPAIAAVGVSLLSRLAFTHLALRRSTS